MALDNSALDNLKNQCEKLKPGTEYVIRMTQQELNKQLKDAMKKTGCDIKIKSDGKIVLEKSFKKDYGLNEILTGLGIFSGGLFTLFIINYFVQLARAKGYYKQGYIIKSKGFQIEKNKDGTYNIIPDENINIIY